MPLFYWEFLMGNFSNISDYYYCKNGIRLIFGSNGVELNPDSGLNIANLSANKTLETRNYFPGLPLQKNR